MTTTGAASSAAAASSSSSNKQTTNCQWCGQANSPPLHVAGIYSVTGDSKGFFFSATPNKHTLRWYTRFFPSAEQKSRQRIRHTLCAICGLAVAHRCLAFTLSTKYFGMEACTLCSAHKLETLSFIIVTFYEYGISSFHFIKTQGNLASAPLDPRLCLGMC